MIDLIASSYKLLVLLNLYKKDLDKHSKKLDGYIEIDKYGKNKKE